MIVKNAETTAQLQIFCEGEVTDTAKATLGDKLRGQALRPHTGRAFSAVELEFTVTYNTATISTDLEHGTAAAAVGAPVIHKGTDGFDWEGSLLPEANGVRALLIEDAGGTGTRQVIVKVDTTEVLKIPQGGHFMISAPQGKLLAGVWNSLVFETDTTATTARVKVTALTEYTPA